MRARGRVRVCVRVPACVRVCALHTRVRARVRGSFPALARPPWECANRQTVTSLVDGGSDRCPYCAQAERESRSVGTLKTWPRVPACVWAIPASAAMAGSNVLDTIGVSNLDN